MPKKFKNLSIIPITIFIVIFYQINALAALSISLWDKSEKELWESDIRYIGAELMVRDSTKDVIVKYVDAIGTGCELSFMHPAIVDSSLLIFKYSLSGNEDEITDFNLGKFPEGTPLVFQNTAIDSSFYGIEMGENSYTGQNRPGLDYYTNKTSTGHFRGCRSAAVRIDSARIRVGFTDGFDYLFTNILFDVFNATLGFIEKAKIPSFIMQPEDTTFSDELNVLFEIKSEALYSITIFKDGHVQDSAIDTSSALDIEGATLQYYYTLDGTNPENSPTRLQYTAPFTISSTTTIKAYAVVEGNPDWYPSEVMTRTYTKSGTVATNRNAAVPVAFNSFQTRNNATLFDISGRRISTNSLTAKQGIQLRKVGNTITRQVVLR